MEGEGILRIWRLLCFPGVVARSKAFFNDKLEMEEITSFLPHYLMLQSLDSEYTNAGQFLPIKKLKKNVQDNGRQMIGSPSPFQPTLPAQLIIKEAFQKFVFQSVPLFGAPKVFLEQFGAG